MRFIGRVLFRLVVRLIVVSAVVWTAIDMTVGRDTASHLSALLREMPQAALVKVADVLGR